MSIRLWPAPREGWYEPRRRSLATLRQCRQDLAIARDEVTGMAAASAWLRYSAKHCPSTPDAIAAMCRARDLMAELAAALDEMGGPGDYDG